jgi:HSP20 family molecular chaperone IbpA
MRTLDFTVTSPSVLWDSIFKQIEDIDRQFEIPNKVNQVLCSADFPCSDMYEDENNALHIDLAVAGMDIDRMSIYFDEKYLYWELKKKEVEKDADGNEIVKEDKRKWVKRGIKSPDTAKVRFFIDQSRYNVEGISITKNDGILSIVVPKKDSYVIKKTFDIKGLLGN